MVAHYVSANLYQQVCTPVSWVGFLTSPFAIVLPQCQALRWIMFNTGNNVSTMWMILGAWFINMVATYGPFYNEPAAEEAHPPIQRPRRRRI